MEYKGHEIVMTPMVVRAYGPYFPPNGKVFANVQAAINAIEEQIKAKDRR